MSDQTSLSHVVVVDDDPDIRKLLASCLSEDNLRCTTLATGAELASVVSSQTVDLVILDLGLPGEDGILIAKTLRRQSLIPILMLTARAHEDDRLTGFEVGADDYLTKPFSTRELVARVRAVLRRTSANAKIVEAFAKARAYRFAGWELNVGLRRLIDPLGVAVPISNGEFNLLAAFVCSPGRALSRDQLLELSRLHNAEVHDRSIDVQILRLRRKIEPDPARPSIIVTQRSAGYLFSVDVEVVR